MNFLYIHTHDSGRCFSPYGFPCKTPYIKILAARGVVCRQAFCANPTCSPSRVSLLTGQYPHSAGMFGLAHRGFAMTDPRRHLAHYLRAQGYETVLCGIQHEGRTETLGYHTVFSKPPLSDGGHAATQADRTAAQQAAAFLRQRPSGNKPFFLSVGFKNTHRPYPSPSPDIDPDRALPPDGTPNVPELRVEAAGLLTALEEVDRNVGTVLEALETAGLVDETLVVFTTDHGIAYPRRKCTLYDGGIGVALILRGAGLPAGRFVDALISQVDIFPTLCELAALPPPPWLEGVSLVSLLRGQAASARETVYAEVNFHAAYEPMRCVRTDRYKYIRRYGERTAPVACNIDDGAAKSYAVAHGLLDTVLPREELYDLTLDPGERENRVDVPAYARILSEMRRRLETWQERTGDPLSGNGTLPLPPGAQANLADALSPNEKDRLYG